MPTSYEKALWDAIEVFKAREPARARAQFESLMKETGVPVEIVEKCRLYLNHLDRRDWLDRIRSEANADPIRREETLKQAKALGLEFGWGGDRGAETEILDESIRKASASIQAAADDRAGRLIESGKTLLYRRDYDGARRSLREAAEVPRIGDAKRKEAQDLIQQVQTEQDLEAKIREHLAAADGAQGRAEYTLAWQELRDARQLQDEQSKRGLNPVTADLARRVEEVGNRAEQARRLDDSLRQAEEWSSADPAKALGIYKDAEKTATDLGLANQLALIRDGRERANRQLEQRKVQAQTKASQAMEALKAREWDKAKQLAEEAQALYPLELAIQIKQWAERASEILATAAGIKEDGKSLAVGRNFGAARKAYAEAKKKLSEIPELAAVLVDPELEALEKASAQGEATAISVETTVKLQGTPCHTRKQLESILLQQQESLDPNRIQDYYKAARAYFRREATSKLQAILQLAVDLIETRDGRELQGVIAQYRIEPLLRGSTNLWQAMWDLLDTKENAQDLQWPPYGLAVRIHAAALNDGRAFNQDEITRGNGPIPALSMRLKIAGARLATLQQAQAFYESQLKGPVEEGTEAMRGRRYDLGLEAWGEAYKALQGATTAEVAYALGQQSDSPSGQPRTVGVAQAVRENLIASAIQVGAAEAAALETEVAEIKANTGRMDTSELAQEHARGAEVRLRKLQQTRALFARVAGEERKNEWPAMPMLDQVGQVKAHYDRAVGWQMALERGWKFLNENHLNEADAEFASIPKDSAAWEKARAGREAVAQVQAATRRQLEAQKTDNVPAELDALVQVLVLAPQNNWARARQQELEPKRQKWVIANDRMLVAQAAMERQDYALVTQLTDAILEEFPREDARALHERAITATENLRRLEQHKSEAQKAFDEGRFEEALDNANRALAIDASETVQRLQTRTATTLDIVQKADAAWREGDTASAEELLQKLPTEVLEVPRVKTLWRGVTDRRSGDQLLEQARQSRAKNDWHEVLALYCTAKRNKKEENWGTLPGTAIATLKAEVRQAIEEKNQDKLDRAGMTIQELKAAEVETDQLAAELERAQLVLSAESAAKSSDADFVRSVEERLDTFCKEHLTDGTAKQALSLVRVQWFQLQAQAKLEGLSKDYSTAAKLLEDAIKLAPTEPAKAGPRQLLASIRTETALQEAERLINAGKLNEARKKLTEASDTDERVRSLRSDLETLAKQWSRLEETPHDVAQWSKTFAELDELQRARPDFEPARTRGKKLEEDLTARGKRASSESRLWEARDCFELLDQVAPGVQTNLEEVRRLLRQKRERLDAAYRALQDDPDFALNDGESLSKDFEAWPESELAKFTTLRDNKDQLKKRLDRVKLLESRIARARRSLDEACENGDFAAAENDLRVLQEHEDLREFARRGSLRRLAQDIKRHKETRNGLQKKLSDYGTLVKRAGEGAPLGYADRPEPIREYVREGTEVLEKALQLNSEILKGDDKNRYKLRNWPEGDPDPLSEEADRLKKQRANLEATADRLLNGIAKRTVGQAEVTLAESKQAAADSDDKLDEALTHRRQAVLSLQEARELFREAARTPALSPRAKCLGEDAATLEEKVGGEIQQAEAEQKKLQEVVQKLKQKHSEANGEYKAGYENNGRGWNTARTLYEDIKRLNPNDQEAQARLRDLDFQEQNRRVEEARRWMLFGGGLFGAMLIAGLIWFFGMGPGNVMIVGTPTLTPTLLITPRPPTATSTVTGTPTFTPTAVAVAVATPTATRTTEPTPAATAFVVTKCVLITNAWVREKPDDGSTGLALLSAGQRVDTVDKQTVTDPQTNQAKEWYKVMGYGPTNFGWINGTLYKFTCN